MRRAALVLLLAISLCALGAAQTKTQSAGVTKALIQKTFDAWSSMDVNKIAPFYSKTDTNIFYDIAPMEYHGWKEWAAGIPKLFADYKSFKLSLKDEPKIHNEGDWAWSTELWHIDSVHKDGKSESMDGRDTTVWHRQGGKWLIVHEHDSLPVAIPGLGTK